MAELKIRKGSFLIQVVDGEVVFATRVPGVEYEDLDKIVIEVEESDTKKPHPEITIDVRNAAGHKVKTQKLKWNKAGKKYD
ncbi:MAG: hypothetical protein KAJ43_11500 [Gemmatimonadetes bacterium]|nr:hypothetical protein [Gemmatimonadota bacterium]